MAFEIWNLKSTRPADIVKLLGSAVTMGKSSSREDSMVDLSWGQPGVPSSITTGESPALLRTKFDLSTALKTDQGGSVKNAISNVVTWCYKWIGLDITGWVLKGAKNCHCTSSYLVLSPLPGLFGTFFGKFCFLDLPQ